MWTGARGVGSGPSRLRPSAVSSSGLRELPAWRPHGCAVQLSSPLLRDRLGSGTPGPFGTKPTPHWGGMESENERHAIAS